MAPWPVRSREKRDYGIDADIDITRNVAGSRDAEVTGKTFSVQLKATDDESPPRSISVTPGHLRYWLEHMVPVLLVSAHLRTQALRARWIDETLHAQLRARNPAFWGQETVSIPLDSGFDLTPAAKSEIEARLARHAQRVVLPPSQFFDLRARVDALASRTEAAGRSSGMVSAIELVARTRAALKLSAYTVAITGPQRVGKSTLVNALLGVEVSPVADYPTTAVPILFESGDRPEAQVHFSDGSHEPVAATADALRPFAAQQEATESAKSVRLIRVSLPNDSFSRGIALVDTPGLHDASEAVRDVTGAALQNADAVLYVLDAALGAKFKLGQHEIADLRQLQTSKERLVVVLNQSDGLEAAKREALQSYVSRELAKYGLAMGLPTPPMFVSGLKAWEARRAGMDAPTEFAALEEELWGHLLKTRKSGLHRLASAVALLLEAVEELGALTSERMTKGLEAADLDSARRVCAAVGEDARKHAKGKLDATAREVTDLLRNLLAEQVATWAQSLNGLPVETPLPSREEVHQALLETAIVARERVWSHLSRVLEGMVVEMNDAVRKALNDARVSLGLSPVVSFDAPNLPALSSIDLSIPEAGWGIFGLLGFLANPVAGVLTTAFFWLMGLDVGRRRRRERVRKQLIAEFEKRLGEVYLLLARQTSERFIAAVHALFRQVESRLDTFMRSAEQRMALLGKPLSPEDAKRLDDVREEIAALRPQLETLAEELRRLST